ncbi:MAG: hypothetical protein D6772_08835, partial [Bacteroidetes bacterium]
ATPAQARQLESRILSRQARNSEAGHLLASALIDFSERTIPWPQAQVSPLGLIQFFGGPERLQHLRLQPNYGCIAWLVPEFMSAYFRQAERWEGQSPQLLQPLLTQLSQRTMEAMVGFFDTYKAQPFQVPVSLRQAWGLSAAESGDQ